MNNTQALHPFDADVTIRFVGGALDGYSWDSTECTPWWRAKEAVLSGRFSTLIITRSGGAR